MSMIQIEIPRKLPELVINSADSDPNVKYIRNGKTGLQKRKRNSNNHSTRNKKKKNIGLSTEIESISEDVQTVNQIFNVNDFAKIISQQDNPVPSQADEKLYIEGAGKFKAKNRFKVDKKRELELERSMNENLQTYQNIFNSQAMQIHKIFKTFSVFICGLFAGISLWQIISTYILLNGGVKNFLDNYYTLSCPVQCLYYMLFAITIIYTLDRYDIMNPSINFWEKVVNFQTGAICIVVYIVGLIFSLAISNIEYRISFHYKNSSVISADDPSTASTLNIWQIVNLIRGLLVLIGWMIVAVKPMTDRLLKTLSSYHQASVIDPGMFAANVQ